MNFSILKKTKFIFLFSAIILLNSCALKPIKSEYNFSNSGLINYDLTKLGKGKVLIYNGANILHKLDNTARLNIWINDKALGQIKPSEYVIIDLMYDKYQFKLLHIDLVNMRSNHQVEINEDTKVIMVKPTVTSNNLKVTNQLPSSFEKYKHVKK